MKRYNSFINRINENVINVQMTLPQDVIDIAKEYNSAGKDLFVVGSAC